jgi:hypothetical protein
LTITADDPQLLLGRLLPIVRFFQPPIATIDLFPHFRGDHITDLPGVFPGESDAIHHAAGVVRFTYQEVDHVFRAAGGVKRVKEFPVATGIDQG